MRKFKVLGPGQGEGQGVKYICFARVGESRATLRYVVHATRTLTFARWALKILRYGCMLTAPVVLQEPRPLENELIWGNYNVSYVSTQQAPNQNGQRECRCLLA